MTIDSHGEQWRAWILENLARYCYPKSLLADMTRDGWKQRDAIAAIDEGLKLLGRESSWRVDLPEPATCLGGFLLERPRIQVLPSVLSQSECSDLIQLALHQGMTAASVVSDIDASTKTHEGRTNSTAFFRPRELPFIRIIEERLSELTHWPSNFAEGLQVQRYLKGQRYTPHYDWFDPNAAGSAKHLEFGGQRLATTIVYLQNASAGGSTYFPRLGLTLSPTAGDAIFFQNVDPTGFPDSDTLHAGEPVEDGVKIIATYWQRAGSTDPS